MNNESLILGILTNWQAACNKITLTVENVSTSRLAQSVEHQTLNLRVVGSSPTLGEAFMRDPFPCNNQYVVKLW